jgi:branched-chain amino acid transport system substrate-binding protein
MNPPKRIPAALALTLALALGSQAAIAQVKIGVIASATGPTAVVGIPQKNTAALLPKTIGDLSVEYVVLDDASDPTQSVLAVRKLLAEHRIDAPRLRGEAFRTSADYGLLCREVSRSLRAAMADSR